MEKWTKKYFDHLTYEIIGSAIAVHTALGPGLLESIYERCLIRELLLREINVRSQIRVPVVYKGLTLDADFRLDLLVDESIIVEVKAVEAINRVYEAQVLSYMKLLQKPKGMIINFCCTSIFHSGQKTFVNELFSDLH
jgi:GxxExxY protein